MKTFLDTPVPKWKKFLAHFKDPLGILLLIATLILLAAWLLEGSHGLLFEALVILAIVLLNAIMGYIHEARAATASSAREKIAVPWSFAKKTLTKPPNL